jgi:hypothetical protein
MTGTVEISMTSLGKGLILIGLLTAVIGFVLLSAKNIPLIGKLPGDFVFQFAGIKIFAPLATCLLLSIIFSFILNFIQAHK